MKRKPKLSKKGYKLAKKTWRKQSALRKDKNARTLASKSRIIAKKENHKFCCKACAESSYAPKTEDGPENYVIYCIVNSSFLTNKGYLAASVARGLLKLYTKVDRNRIKAKALDNWEDSGEKVIILDGSNHKHLMYLAGELAYAAVETAALYKTWGKSRIILVLSVIGREEFLEEPLDGLSHLR